MSKVVVITSGKGGVGKTTTSANVATGLRLKLIDSLLGVRWSYFTRQPVGRFANAVSNEAARASEAYSASATLMANLVQAAVYVLLTLLVSWQLGALWLYLTAPVLGAAIAVPACRCVREAGCCAAAEDVPA